MEDLNRALFLQPLMSNAYWHRHLLFLLQGTVIAIPFTNESFHFFPLYCSDNDRAALEDLGSLLKLNKTHHMGFHSRALLLAKKGDLVNAIFSLNYAINLQPNDISLYLLRAELFEKVDVIILILFY